jgi:RimJ/RimL family protein N-acetyltransferase
MFGPLETRNQVGIDRQWQRAYMGERSNTLCIQTRNVELFIDQLAVIYAQAFSGDPWFEDWTPDSARAELQSCVERGAVFVISLDPETSRALGCGVGLPMTDPVSSQSFRERGLLRDTESSTTYYVAELCTAADMRNKGICSDVLAGLLQAGRDAGCERVLTRTRPDNKGMIRVFEKSGFSSLARYLATTGGVTSEREVFLAKL